jgi:hypothetical protein
MTPDEFYDLAADKIDNSAENYREKRSYRGASIRQWRKRFANYSVLMTEHKSTRKVTFTTRNARIVMIDLAYWTTESGERETRWQKEPPSDEEVITAMMMLP